MVENYTKDLKESVYHGAVVSTLAVGYTMLGKTLIKMSPPSLSKFDIEDGVKLVAIVALSDFTKDYLQSVSWILAEFYFNRGLQRLYTGTCIILQKTINGFLCLLIVFLKSKTYQLILKDMIKLNRNLR